MELNYFIKPDLALIIELEELVEDSKGLRYNYNGFQEIVAVTELYVGDFIDLEICEINFEKFHSFLNEVWNWFLKLNSQKDLVEQTQSEVIFYFKFVDTIFRASIQFLSNIGKFLEYEIEIM